MTVGETDGRRAIAVRNRDALLTVALDVINRDPDASMNEIADAAALGRATLYRHFPTREDLLTALRQRAREQGIAAMDEARPDDGDPIAALERIVDALFAVGKRNRVLFGPGRAKPSLAERERHFEPVTRTFERAQRDGIIASDITANWLTTALRHLLGAAATEIESGRLKREDAPALVIRQLIDGARKH
jgi:TetR/AcrR family transcriptional repressor of mexCD-oprJ operon